MVYSIKLIKNRVGWTAKVLTAGNQKFYTPIAFWSLNSAKAIRHAQRWCDRYERPLTGTTFTYKADVEKRHLAAREATLEFLRTTKHD